MRNRARTRGQTYALFPKSFNLGLLDPPWSGYNPPSSTPRPPHPLHTHTYTHTSVHTLCFLSTSLLFVLVPGIVPALLWAMNKCLLIKLKAISLGIYFWCIYLSQSHPHTKGPYAHHFFKELLASSPGRINISPCVHSMLCILEL